MVMPGLEPGMHVSIFVHGGANPRIKSGDGHDD